jgi:asparagine synthase (glutamine-hydrolysing)
MPKGLYALRDVPKVPDGDRIAEFLAHIPRHGSQSYFRGIERVESGHVVIFSLTGLIARRYWQPNRKSLSLRRPDDYVDALRELLDRAVRCRLRGAEDVAVQLSGGLDSSGVAATAARQLAEVGHRVVAFTAVPRTGFNGVTPRNRIADEGPLAAATAAMYPNIEHVLIRTEGRTVLDDLDCGFLLYDEPVRNLCNNIWANCIYDAIRERKLTVLLVGNMGNLGLSYDGMELLPELFRQGQWIKLLLEGRALAAREGWRWSGFLKRTFAPWCPAPIWSLLNRMTSGDSGDVLNYSAILPTRFAELKLRMRASNHSFDLTGRSAKDSFTALRSIFFGFESGNGNKGALAGWHIDERDPTADIRLLEFCLAVPADQFLSDGIPRALGRRTLEDRIPKIVLEERSRGLQSADWYEGLTAARDQIAAELSQMDSCPAVARMIDLPRLRQLVEKWPSEGWERSDIINSYYFALVRAVSAGHFLRRASDDNS